MAWLRDKLTDTTVRKAKPGTGVRKMSDGRGLQLWVMPNGGRYWRLEYRFGGKTKLLALGTYPDVSLRDAREKAHAARRQLDEGRDPSAVKREVLEQRRLFAANTFGAVADRLVEKKVKAGRAPVTITKVKWILGKLEASLAPMPIAAIRTLDVVAALRREEDTGNLETARRMRTVIGEVFRLAMQHGIADADPSAATRGAIASPKQKHHAAITDEQKLGDLLRLIDIYAQNSPITGAALQLMALLYPRPGELRQALWSEFDLERALWTVPAERMKLRQAHVKPLSRQAIAILRTLKELTGPEGYVFPAVGRSRRPMSENTMNLALRRMGVGADVHTSHGFRATASTILNASNRFSPDAIERSLAHQDRDAVRRAYARGDAMTERRVMAQWWADLLDGLRGDATTNVLPMVALRDRRPR
ncbi:MAG TPA: integrase arm-type DNA-binding domain-containing protein [Micropepsaceae bacterium]|nr:integrase arm-type DNA-binding domain-containing protein [Micropepsaceae bacterium]